MSNDKCGKITADGTPCDRPPGCTMNHNAPGATEQPSPKKKAQLKEAAAPKGTFVQQRMNALNPYEFSTQLRKDHTPVDTGTLPMFASGDKSPKWEKFDVDGEEVLLIEDSGPNYHVMIAATPTHGGDIPNEVMVKSSSWFIASNNAQDPQNDITDEVTSDLEWADYGDIKDPNVLSQTLLVELSASMDDAGIEPIRDRSPYTSTTMPVYVNAGRSSGEYEPPPADYDYDAEDDPF